MKRNCASVFVAWLIGLCGVGALYLEWTIFSALVPQKFGWLFTLIGVFHYLATPILMGAAMAIIYGPQLWLEEDSISLGYIATLLCLLSCCLIYCFFSFSPRGSGDWLLNALFSCFVAFTMTPTLFLPWIFLLSQGAQKGALWHLQKTRNEFFGRWSRGEIEK